MEALEALPRLFNSLHAVPPPSTAQELIDLGNQIDANNNGKFSLKEVSKNLRGRELEESRLVLPGEGQRHWHKLNSHTK